ARCHRAAIRWRPRRSRTATYLDASPSSSPPVPRVSSASRCTGYAVSAMGVTRWCGAPKGLTLLVRQGLDQVFRRHDRGDHVMWVDRDRVSPEQTDDVPAEHRAGMRPFARD